VDDELETERSQRLMCEECGCDSDEGAAGWEGHLGTEDDDTETVVFFLPFVRGRVPLVGGLIRARRV
jgi:hypothetical protein